jgi:predicted aspartyl protease
MALPALVAAGQAPLPTPAKPRPATDAPVTGAPPPPAVIDEKLEVGGEDVAAKKVRTRLLLDVAINGRGPYRFVVDSGADSSAVGLRIARDLALPVVDQATITTSTARQVIDRVRVEKFDVGPTAIRNLKLPALAEENIGGDGIIGIDALVKQRLKMDFRDKTVKVEDARKPDRHEPGEIVVTARRTRGQLILTEVRASDIRLQAVIDTGSEITIGNEALRRALAGRQDAQTMVVPVTGVTGVVQNVQLAVIDQLQVGPILMRNVPVAFADIPPFKLFGLDQTPSLLLGTDVLELFRSISLDFRSRRVRFQLATCRDQAVTVGAVTLTEATRIRPSADSIQCSQR